MVDEVITRQELIDAKRDARDLGKAVNEKVIVSPRYGDDFKSLPLLSDEAQSSINGWDEAIRLITYENGVPALAVSDASGKTQQEINDELYGDFHFAKKWGVIADGNHYPLSDLWTDTPRRKFNTLADFQAYYSTTENTSSTQSIDFFLLQYAIDQLSAVYLSTGVAQTLLLAGNKTYVGRTLFSKAGVNLISYNGFATLKKRPALALTENDVKTWRVLESERTGISFNSELGRKHRIVLQNLIFDGNQSNMNWTTNTYNQEQGMSLILSTPNLSTFTSSDNRIKYDLINVSFKDSVSDGLCVNRNCDIQFDTLNAENCFRGGLSVVGGNNIINGDKYIGDKARFDIEVDLASAGYGSSLVNQIYINYVEIDKNGSGHFGGMDLSALPASNIHLGVVRCYSSPVTWNMVANESDIATLKPGILTIDDWYSECDSIVGYGWSQNFTIKKAKFVYKPNSWRSYVNSSTYTGAIILYQPAAASPENAYGYKGRKLYLHRPDFTLDASLLSPEDVREFSCLRLGSFYRFMGNEVTLHEPVLGSGFTYGLQSTYGGVVKIKGGIVNSKYFARLIESVGEANKGVYNTFDVTFEGEPEFGITNTNFIMFGLDDSVVNVGETNASILRFKNFKIPFTKGVVTAVGSYFTPILFEGNRRLLKQDGGLSITGSRCFSGDIVEHNLPNSNGVKSYIAMGSGFISATSAFAPLEKISRVATTTYNPPSIAANATVTTAVALNGVVVGDVVQSAFSQYNADIEISAVVSAANTVTVKFKNTGAAAVDLASGTLTVKLI